MSGVRMADDPSAPLGPWLKGFPPDAAPVAVGDIAARNWNVLAGDLPLPLAVLDRDALAHNVQWMQAYARSQGVDLAPHGKTTMAPQLFQRQLDAGAWGITFANVFQLRVGVAAGVRRAIIANQLVQAIELAALQALRVQHADLRVVFLVDSLAQLQRIEAWFVARAVARHRSRCCSRSASPAAAPACARTVTHSRWRARCTPAPRCGWSASSVMKAWAPPATARATTPMPAR